MRPRLLSPADLAAVAARYRSLVGRHMEAGWNEREQAYADDVPDLLAHIAALETAAIPPIPAPSSDVPIQI